MSQVSTIINIVIPYTVSGGDSNWDSISCDEIRTWSLGSGNAGKYNVPYMPVLSDLGSLYGFLWVLLLVKNTPMNIANPLPPVLGYKDASNRFLAMFLQIQQGVGWVGFRKYHVATITLH